jgi:hypothetical protein
VFNCVVFIRGQILFDESVLGHSSQRILNFLTALLTFVLISQSGYFKPIKILGCLNTNVILSGYDKDFNLMSDNSQCNGRECFMGEIPPLCQYTSYYWTKVLYNGTHTEDNYYIVPMSNFWPNLGLSIFLLMVQILVTAFVISKTRKTNRASEYYAVN